MKKILILAAAIICGMAIEAKTGKFSKAVEAGKKKLNQPQKEDENNDNDLEQAAE